MSQNYCSQSQHFLGLHEFHQTFSFDAFWDKVECLNVWRQKVKHEGHSMAKVPEVRPAEAYGA